MKRLIGSPDAVESDFKTAVLRFSDDTFEKLGVTVSPGGPEVQAQKLATESDARVLKQTGANLAARVAMSILNQEKPGFFFAAFDGGKRGRFNFVLDYQNRIPVANFDVNAGEKGLIYSNRTNDYYNEVWMAFYGLDDFRMVANEHFARSPIAQKYNLNSLDWFFKEWVYHTELPSYQMDYQVQDSPDGKFLLTGTITQQNVPDDWFMPLPVVITFPGKQEARGTVHGLGPKANFQIKLPIKPTKVELDPDHWVLSEKTSTKGP